MHLIEQVFGEGCDLYDDVLSCPRDADKAQLRKHYYRAALKYHPDRNPGNEQAHHQFQAISLAYQILHDPDSRQEYDETGVIPDVIDEEDKQAASAGADQWKQYFDQIFGKVTTSEIDAFASKYKCSDEEKRDVLKEFRARKGNLVKMVDFVMLSEFRDAKRWVEDYILPAMEAGEVDEKHRTTMEKTLKKCQEKVDKETKAAQMEEDEKGGSDDEETETEEDEDEPQSRRKATATTKQPPKKAKPTQAKRKKKTDKSMQDLVAQIQNKNRGGAPSLFADLGARYGVSMEADEDPLNDAEFAKIQSELKKKRCK